MSQNTDLALGASATSSTHSNPYNVPKAPMVDSASLAKAPLPLTDRQEVADAPALITSAEHTHDSDQPAHNENDAKNLIPDPATPASPPIADYWSQPAIVAPNNFVNKSLSTHSYNPTIGCGHGCLYCYVPSVSTIKQGPALLAKGVQDPDAEWGSYVLVRPLDEKALLASIRKADAIPLAGLKADGNRAVMFCTTTDPYQRIRHHDRKKAKELTKALRQLVRRGMEVIRDESTLRIRVLTRGTEAVVDFELMETLGDRLLFGMSLPTLDDGLARIYEPNAPAPSARLKVLQAAKAKGLNIYVAMAPTYPECDEADLRATLLAIKELDPVTVFHEPINIRADNVERIRVHAEAIGKTLNTDVFATTEAWEKYAIGQLKLVERIAGEVGLGSRLHLWPDKALGSKAALARVDDAEAHQQWLDKWWGRISEWPGKPIHSSKRPQANTRRTTLSKKAASPVVESVISTRHPDDFLAMEFDPADNYLDGGICAKRQVTTLVGPPGIGKSQMLLMLAACTILGRDFFGLKVNAKNLKWLIIQQENSDPRLQADFRRLKAWVGEADWPRVNEHLVVKPLGEAHAASLDLQDTNTYASLSQLARREQADVVAFDPMTSFGSGLNTDDGMRRTYDRMVEIARQGNKDAAVVIVHHASAGRAGAAKAVGYDRGIYGRGSKALLAFTRGQMNVAPASEDDHERVIISCGKNSNGPAFEPVGLRLNADTQLYEVDPEFDLETWKMEITGRTDKRLKFSSQDVAELVRERGLKRAELVLKLMEITRRGKSTAYALIAAAEDQTIMLNKHAEYVAV